MSYSTVSMANSMAKTFGRKASRMRKAEKEALELYLQKIKIPEEEIITCEKTFGRAGSLIVEIGFGKGEFLYEMALRRPEANFVGIDVFLTGVAKLLRRMCHYENSNLPEPGNIRVLLKEAATALRENFPERSISELYILFPDPWPKKRHHKRRLIKPEFTQLLKEKLKPEGFVLVATDHEGYMQTIRESFLQESFTEELSSEPLVLQTKYARKALTEGRPIYQFIYKITSVQK